MGRNTSNGEVELREIIVQPTLGMFMNQYVPLQRAALKGDWVAAKDLLIEDNTLIKAQITEGGETVFHIAAMEGHTTFVANLLECTKDYHVLEIKNVMGCIALTFAAAAGHIDIAMLMIKINPHLTTIQSHNGVMPLDMAVMQGHSEMANYLFQLSHFDVWTPERQIGLLNSCIENGLNGLAMSILESNKMLAVAKDSDGEAPLHVLARMPWAFCGSTATCQLIPPAFQAMFSKMKLEMTPSKKDEFCDAHELLGYLWDQLILCHQERGEVIQEFIGETTSNLLFTAAESGNDEFMVELIRRYPSFLYKVNESNYSVFHIAVLHRHIQVFNLIYELRGVRELVTTYTDLEGNNILHLAARLAHESQLNLIPGAALQMQREVLWYKEVEKMVKPSFRNMENNQRQTPHDVFISAHKNLMKEGEKGLKQIAKSCMLVTFVIAAVVFTNAFTVPGGFNNISGAPTLKDEWVFVLFPMSEAVATLSCLTSMLMFLSMLTSGYSENDFLQSLPFSLIIGVTSLFVSILAMMTSFCRWIIFYGHNFAILIFIILTFATVVAIYMVWKYRLLASVLRSTYSSRWLFRSNDRLLA